MSAAINKDVSVVEELLHCRALHVVAVALRIYKAPLILQTKAG
jgi:hypothetical protein